MIANPGYLVVVSIYFLIVLGIIFPIIYWFKPRSSSIIQMLIAWFQTLLVMTCYVFFLWLASRDMIKTDLLIVAGGLVVFFIGVFIMLDALFVIKTGILVPLEKVVNTKIYSYVRHPIYVGTSFILVGLAICFWSFFAIVEAGIISILFIILTFSEEKELTIRFGKKYSDYKKKTSRFNVFKGLFLKLKSR